MYTLKNKPTVLKVNFRLATEWANMEGCPADRPLSPRRLEVYKQFVEQKTFRSCTWAKAYCKETSKVYRVNGKHTSTLFTLWENAPLPQEIFVHLEDYECDTLTDVARLYGTFDSKLQGRTSGDINTSFASTIPSLADLPPRLINMSVSGIAYGVDGDQYSKIQPSARAERLLENEQFVLFLSGLLQGPNVKMVNRAPVVGAMYRTYQKDREACQTFWLAVRDETGPTPELPCRKLAKFLGANAVNHGNGSQSPNGRKATNKEFMSRCILAWNAFRRGTLTNLAYHAGKEVPEVL